MAEYYSIVVDHILFFYSSVDGHLGCFHILSCMNMLLQTFIFKFLGEHMLSVLLGIYLAVKFLSHVEILCLTFWETASVLQSGRSISHSYQQYLRSLNSSHHHQHLLLCYTLKFSTEEKWWIFHRDRTSCGKNNLMFDFHVISGKKLKSVAIQEVQISLINQKKNITLILVSNNWLLYNYISIHPFKSTIRRKWNRF